MDKEQNTTEALSLPENAVLIDLREEEDYDTGHIPGARRISMGSLRDEIRRIARFNTPILLYCHNGKTSAQAAELLQSRGYVNARSLGGMDTYAGPLEPELTIREIREKKGLSQAALARMIGVRQPTVAAYESGKAHPGPVIRDSIRRLLSVSVAPAEKGAGKDGKTPGKARRKRNPALKKAMTIRELRDACGLTQGAFAESVGICAGSVAAYECGRTKPRPKVLEKIREVYQVEILAPNLRERERIARRNRVKA